jgi:hypothetical protein
MSIERCQQCHNMRSIIPRGCGCGLCGRLKVCQECSLTHKTIVDFSICLVTYRVAELPKTPPWHECLGWLEAEMTRTGLSGRKSAECCVDFIGAGWVERGGRF